MRISVEQVFETVQMTMDQHFDIRTVTLGINLKDCMDRDSKAFNKRVHDRIVKMGKRLNTFSDELESKYGVPIINRRISITPKRPDSPSRVTMASSPVTARTAIRQDHF